MELLEAVCNDGTHMTSRWSRPGSRSLGKGKPSLGGCALMIAVFAFLAGFPAFCYGDVISTFDTGWDGWTPSGSDIFLATSGGNPDGYVRCHDGGPNQSPKVFAPESYLGDWSSSYPDGSLSFDFRVFEVGSAASYGSIYAQIEGDDGNAVATFIHRPARRTSPWYTVTAPLVESEWRVDRGSWDELLRDVESLCIELEWVENWNPTEKNGLDNVALVPEPATLSLLLMGAPFAWRKRNRA